MQPPAQAREGSLGSEIGSQAVTFDGDRRLAARRCPRWVHGGLGWSERGCNPHPARPGHSRRPSRRPSTQGSSSRGPRHRLDVMHRIQVAQDGANVAGWCHHRRRGQSRRVRRLWSAVERVGLTSHGHPRHSGDANCRSRLNRLVTTAQTGPEGTVPPQPGGWVGQRAGGRRGRLRRVCGPRRTSWDKLGQPRDLSYLS